MVRVNLLPDRRQASRRAGGAADTSQLWILGVFGAIVLYHRGLSLHPEGQTRRAHLHHP